MSGEQIKITADRLITLPVSLLAHSLITVALVIAIYYSQKYDIASVTKESHESAEQLAAMRERLAGVEKTTEKSNAKFDMFVEMYNQDMNKYIRDRGAR